MSKLKDKLFLTKLVIVLNIAIIIMIIVSVAITIRETILNEFPLGWWMSIWAWVTALAAIKMSGGIE